MFANVWRNGKLRWRSFCINMPCFTWVTIRTTVNKVTKSKPPRPPDLNPLDYFLWGHLKSLVYIIPIENENDLRNRIVASCEAIRNTPGIFERVHQSLRRRLDGCIMCKVDIFNYSSNCFISSEELKPVFVFLFLTSFLLV